HPLSRRRRRTRGQGCEVRRPQGRRRPRRTRQALRRLRCRRTHLPRRHRQQRRPRDRPRRRPLLRRTGLHPAHGRRGSAQPRRCRPSAARWGIKPLSIWLSPKLKRAGAGGTGFAKCGGNYASSLVPTNEAAAKGCQQVLFTDAEENKYIDELGGMNLMLVTKGGKLLTPALSDSILDGE